jgi:hypothetical protein
MVTTQNVRQIFLCITYKMTNTNLIIQRKHQHKNTQNFAVLNVTKLTNKSSHNTAKDSYKHPQHISKHSLEKPHRIQIYMLIKCMEYTRD